MKMLVICSFICLVIDEYCVLLVNAQHTALKMSILHL